MQHVPDVDDLDVERIIKRDFSPDLFREVKTILEAYGREAWHGEVDRVRLAVLKLSAGRLDQLQREVDAACRDYRDTLLAAEYPYYGKMIFGTETLSEKEQSKIAALDRQHYEDWLTA